MDSAIDTSLCGFRAGVDTIYDCASITKTLIATTCKPLVGGTLPHAVR